MICSAALLFASDTTSKLLDKETCQSIRPPAILLLPWVLSHGFSHTNNPLQRTDATLDTQCECLKSSSQIFNWSTFHGCLLISEVKSLLWVTDLSFHFFKQMWSNIHDVQCKLFHLYMRRGSEVFLKQCRARRRNLSPIKAHLFDGPWGKYLMIEHKH